MKKIYYFVLMPYVLGIACLVAFNIIGSHIDNDGTLVEPFWLIPIGYLMFFIGLVESLFFGIIYLVKTNKKI